MTRDRKKQQKAIARDGTQQVSRRKMKPGKRNVPVQWMDETQIMESLIDEYEAEEAAPRGKK
jgi:hypothetical protein